ncbi:MAG: NHL repeat-containing protein [Acidobacteriaceae bacterium]
MTNFVRTNPSSSSQSTQGGVTELTKASGFSAASAFNISGTSAEYNATKIVAIDPSGNVWLTNGLSGDVVELTKASGYSAAAAIEISGFADPSGIAADPAGDIWIADWGPSGVVWELPYSAISAPGATGASIAAQAIGIGGFSFASMVAVDPSGNVWVTNLGTMFLQQGSIPGSIVELTKASNYSPAGVVKITGWDGNNVVPFDIAADSSGNIWMTGATVTATGGIGTPLVTELTKASNYSPASAVNITGWETPSTTGSPTQVGAPLGIAIDGGGNVWLTVTGASLNTTTQQTTANYSIVELTKASNYSFSSAVNYSSSAAGFDIPMGIAIDGSGNVWVTESGVFVVGAEIQAVSQSASITELVQAAVPVTPPLL